MQKYNILFLTVDSWNRNFVGCFNEKAKHENITPNLFKFSNNCITFSSAYSPSVKTSASFPAILSGCYPCKYGDWFNSISDKRILISEILQKNGYATYGFTSNPCTSSLRKYDKGFDFFEDDNIVKNLKGRMLQIFLTLKTFLNNPYNPANEINNQVLSLLEKSTMPYFVWVHYMDVHGPYISEHGWQFKERLAASRLWNKAISTPHIISNKEKMKLIDVYKEKNRFLDYYIGEMLKEVDDDNTIVILTADHGDVFGERGFFAHPFIFYNEMINVPLFIKLPRDMKVQNRNCSHPVSLMDIVPTLIDILKIDFEHPFDGHSLVPLIENRENEYQAEYILSEISRQYVCAIKGKWKLIANFAESSFELYDLEMDKDERTNLHEKELDIFHELINVIKNHIAINMPGDHNPYYNQ